jgi:hypothetical protein
VAIIAWIVYTKPTQSESIAGLGIIIALFIINGVIAFILHFVDRYKSTLFIANSLAAPILFLTLFLSWYSYDDWVQYKHYSFSKNGTNYDLTINKKGKDYTLTKFSGLNASKDGLYILKNDTVFFSEDSMGFNKLQFKYYMVKKILYGFPDKNDVIFLK